MPYTPSRAVNTAPDAVPVVSVVITIRTSFHGTIDANPSVNAPLPVPVGLQVPSGNHATSSFDTCTTTCPVITAVAVVTELTVA
jgi:hypothetical protein